MTPTSARRPSSTRCPTSRRWPRPLPLRGASPPFARATARLNRCRPITKTSGRRSWRLTCPLVLRFLSLLTHSIAAQGRDIASVSEAISQLYRQKDRKLGDCFGRFRSLAIFAICVTVFMRMGTKERCFPCIPSLFRCSRHLSPQGPVCGSAEDDCPKAVENAIEIMVEEIPP